MSSKRLTITLSAIALAAAATVGAVVTATRGTTSATVQGAVYLGSIPPPDIRLPDFSLPRYNGGTVRASSLGGKVVLATFVDSACHDKCPIIVGIIGRALPRLTAAERAQVRPLAFSVDPNLDTPAHVTRFLESRGAVGLEYLVGTVAQMRPLWKQFAVLAAAESGNADVHSASVRIYDRRGIWVSNQHVGVDLTPANLVHDIRLALRSRP